MDCIFDHAYLGWFGKCESQPISKRLLPFHQRVLLHTFSPHKWKSLRLFNRAITRDPTLVIHIKRVNLEYLHIKSWEREQKETRHAESLAALLRSIRNVEEITFAQGSSEMAVVFWAQVDRDPRLFPRLRSLEVEILNEDHGQRSPTTGLSPLQHLHTLNELTVSWPFASTISLTHFVHLPLVKELHFEGEGAGEPSNLALILSCPSLSELEFYDVLGNNDQALDAILPNISRNISENLSSLSISGEIGTLIDLYLSRFTHLRNLELGRDSYGPDLARHLSPLSLLETLCLDYAQHDLEGLDAILDGPYRLRLPLTLELKFKLDERGTRIDPDVKRERGVWDDFWWSGALRYDGGQLEYLEALIERARTRGIYVYGEATKRRAATEVYLVELFNRSVLDLGSEEGHERLQTAYTTASEYNYPLPRFNLDKTFLETSCIVKIPIPNQDWFVLSREQKKVEDSEGDQEMSMKTVAEV